MRFILRSAALTLLCVLLFGLSHASAQDAFLSGDAAPAFTYYASREDGFWEYTDPQLHIIIHRREDAENAIVWFETEIRCQGSTRFYSYMADGDTPGTALISPKTYAKETGAVLAFNDDYFGARRMNGSREGVVVRNGQIFSNNTYESGNTKFPPLEIMALFADGRMETFDSSEYTAEEYLAMGVTDTYAFGPILVRDGQLGPLMYDEEYSPYREPRCAIGMIAPNHYIVLTVMGRTDDSKGVRLPWLADKMLELGAVEALNLDGGRTTALYIMGDLITHGVKVMRKDVRGVNSLIGIGQMPDGYLAE